ncbi:MAG TPA: D-aminoacyl-tRNA deacylase, partial [Draconibacterium sp.]|nr:D-aminoacyl-tRNA deacylase [Draconibacterium sp.]
MRVVIQRVSEASVKVEGKVLSAIHQGMLILVGIEDTDMEEDISWLTNKIIQLRIFDDENGVMNLSVKDVGGDIIVVSQFT